MVILNVGRGVLSEFFSVGSMLLLYSVSIVALGTFEPPHDKTNKMTVRSVCS